MAGAISQVQRDARQFGPKDEGRPDWLITGFGPFPRVPQNPSAVLALRLAKGWSLRGQSARAHVFTTSYAAAKRDIPALAALRPSAVLMLGVAPRAKRLRVEQRAINRRAAGAKDAQGKLPTTPVIAPCAAAFAQGRHKGAALVARLRMGGLNARLSRDAGRYLCNFAYWSMLSALPGVPVVFIHIPMPRGGKKGDTRPDLAAMERGLRALMRGRP